VIITFEGGINAGINSALFLAEICEFLSTLL